MRLVAVALALAFLVPGCVTSGGTDEWEDGDDRADEGTDGDEGLDGEAEWDESDAAFAELDARLAVIDETIEDALNASDIGEFDFARGLLADTRREIRLAYQDYLDLEDLLVDDDQRIYRALFELKRDYNTYALGYVAWSQDVAVYEATLEEEDEAGRLAAAYAGEFLVASGTKFAEAASALAVKARFLREVDPETAEALGIDAAWESALEETVAVVEEWNVFVAESVEETAESEAFTPASDRAIPAGEPVPLPENLVSAELVAFFDSFDADADGVLDVAEAQEFYYWVEEHVPYRYDDEEETDPMPGFEVGDGREGPDHWQTPNETFAERAGDCEDVNGLEVAFYNHWGVQAFQAYVNADSEDAMDHAIAIVLVGDDREAFEAVLGRLDAYEIEEGNEWGIPAGVYMIVDNAYSDHPGRISGGISPGRFTIFAAVPLGDTFDFEVE